MGLTRIVQRRSATLSHTFYSDGVAADPSPDSASVTITRADGTVLTPAGSVDNTAAGVAKITLTPDETADLDTLTLRWTASFAGQPQTFVDTVEIAGGTLFAIAQARDALGDPAYDAAKIAKARTYAETELERALGYALVPRYHRETLSGSQIPGGFCCRSDSGLRLTWPYIRTVRAISIDGVALTDLSNVTTDGGFLYGGGWTRGWGNIVVGYEHGLEVPPPGAERAALDEALAYLGGDSGGGSVDARAESIVTADGTIRLRSSGSANLLSATASNWVSANRLIAIA